MNLENDNSSDNQEHSSSDLLQRFSFTLQSNLIDELDHLGKSLGMNRSMVVREALANWISTQTKLQESITGKGVGLTSYIYDHHDTRVVSELMHAQHNHEKLISSTTHVHLSHVKCFEIIILKGDMKEMNDLNNSLRSVKGISSFSDILIPG